MKLTLGSYGFITCCNVMLAEIEDIGNALPDCARCMPASIISSPDNPDSKTAMLSKS